MTDTAPETSMESRPQGDFAYGPRSVCPTCGAGVGAAQPAVASLPPAETLSVEAHAPFRSGVEPGRIFFSYVRCQQCGTHWAPVYYSQVQLDRLKSQRIEDKRALPLAARAATKDGYAALALSVPTPVGDFLEIGADIGLFAQSCAARSQFQHYILYEGNADLHPMARERLKGRRVELRADSFDPKHHKANTVALAAAIHVVDQVLDPRALLRGLKQVLAPGGLLLVVVDDAGTPLARLLGRRFPPLSLQHPQLFDRESLPALLRAEGLEPVLVRRTGAVWPLGHLAAAGLRSLGRTSAWVPLGTGPLIRLPFGKIGVVARKSA